MNKLERVVHSLQNDIQWEPIFILIKSLGKSLNGQKDRFIKSDLIEKSITVCSNEILEHVDIHGQDHHHTNLDASIEIKYHFGSLVTPAGNEKKVVSGIKLLNTQGTNKHTELPETYSDYLIVVDRCKVVMIPKTTMQKYIVCNGDGIVLKGVPMTDCYVIADATDTTMLPNVDLQVKEKLDNLYMSVIDMCLESQAC